MATVGNKGDIITVGSNVRIERGPKLVKAVATVDLLDNRNTASHYAPGMRDAKGEPIVEGAEFHYLDHGGSEAEGRFGYYVYKRRDLTDADREKEETTYAYRYDEIGFKPTEEAALELAQKHAID